MKESKILTDHNSNSQANITQQSDENDGEETDEDDDEELVENVVLQALTQAANSQAILLKPAVPIQRKVEKAKWTEEEVRALPYYFVSSYPSLTLITSSSLIYTLFPHIHI